MAFSIQSFGGVENTTDAVTNTSSVTWSWTLKTTNGSHDHTGNAWYRIYTSDGTYDTGKLYFKPGATSGSKTKTYSNTTGQFAHNGDGSLASKIFNLDFYENANSRHYYSSYTQPFTTYARYATITSFNVYQRDETSLNVVWGANATCDYAWYRIRQNGGSFGNWVGGVGTNFNITGLSPNTTYYVQIRVRRQDSQLTTDSNEYGQTTYDYPNCTLSPDFVVGNSVTLGFYNPLNRSFTYEFIDATDTTIETKTISGVSDTLTPNASDLYNSIPNSINGAYKIKVTYGSSERTKTGNKYSINTSTNVPTFENFASHYVADQTALTNDDQTVINGASTVTFTIDADATAQNGATIDRYSVVWGNTTPQTIEDITQEDATLVNGTGGFVTVVAYDSRGLNASIDIPFSEIITYTAPTNLSVNIHRRNGVEATTYADITGIIYYDTFGSQGVSNLITGITYSVAGGGTNMTYDITDITYSEQSSTNHTQRFTIEDVPINEDVGETGFDVNNSYAVTFTVTDTSNTQKTVSNIVKSGKFAEHWTRDENGNYHFGCNGLADDNYVAKFYGSIWADNLGGSTGSLPIGSIILYPSGTLPDSYMLCDGTSLSKTDYSDLFDVIGYTYGGSGDNFNLPDIKGRTVFGYDSSQTEFNALNKRGGIKTQTLQVANLPNQQGWFQSRQASGTNILDTYGSGGVFTYTINGGNQWGNQIAGGLSQSQNANALITYNNGGSSTPFSVLNQYITLNYIIKVTNDTPLTATVKNEYSTSADDAYSCSYVNNHKQDTLTAGTGIDITNNVISNTQTSAEWGNISGDIEDQTDLQDALDDKQDTLVSGTNIKTINNESLLGSGDIHITADAEIAIQTTQPTGDETLWINPDEALNPASASDIYSTQETVIGRWISGKPLYRRVIVVEDSPTTVLHTGGDYINVPLNRLPLKKMTRFDVLLTGNDGINQEVNKFITPYRYDANNDKVTLSVDATYGTTSIIVILEYTKTTD